MNAKVMEKMPHSIYNYYAIHLRPMGWKVASFGHMELHTHVSMRLHTKEAIATLWLMESEMLYRFQLKQVK